MAKQAGSIGSVRVTFNKKKSGERAITGHFAGVYPKSFYDKKPIIKVIEARSIITDCSAEDYLIREIEVIGQGNVGISRFYTDSIDNQYAGFKRIAGLFIQLKELGLTTPDGQIMFKQYSDWEKTKPTVVGKDDKKETTSTDKKETAVTVTKTTPKTTTTTTTTTRTFERIAMFVRRKGKKPSKKVLDSMRDKVKAIADGTYEYKVPCLLKKIELDDVEIEVVDTEKPDKFLKEAQDALEEAFNSDCGGI